MVPGSTTKLLTEGTMLELFGGDYRFHTRVYRTGPLKKDGVLEGRLDTDLRLRGEGGAVHLRTVLRRPQASGLGLNRPS